MVLIASPVKSATEFLLSNVAYAKRVNYISSAQAANMQKTDSGYPFSIAELS